MSLTEKIRGIINLKNIENENANMNEYVFTAKQTRMANEIAKEYASKELLSEDVLQAFQNNEIYIHDFNSYAIGMHNCMFVDLADILQRGFKTTNGEVRPPQSIRTAMQLVAVIFQCQSNCQFGGIAANKFDYDMATYVGKSFINHFKTGLKYFKNNVKISEDDIHISNKPLQEAYPLVYEYAYEQTVLETEQSAEALIHNLNTLESRSGNQLPFTSVNYGTDTSEEGRLVIRSMLKATIKGVGRNGTTPIFPIQIWKYKKGVSALKGDPNYDLKQLAIECSSKRIYPNFVNIDAPHLPISTNPDEEHCSMGCVDGQEIITYKLYDSLYVESFERMYSKLSKFFKEQTYGISTYMDLKNVEIYDSSRKSFVKCERIIKNPDKSDWILIKLNNGRNLLATADHPLPIKEKGRTFVSELKVGDEIPITYEQYSESVNEYGIEKAWLDGVILCDGCYQSGQLRISLGMDEKELVDKVAILLNKLYDIDTRAIEQKKGEKGFYYDVVSVNTKKEKLTYFENLFGGVNKVDRQIPSAIFSSRTIDKLAFMAGMIDADGHIKVVKKGARIEIGSTNKELALQQLALIQSLGIPAKVYLNRYSSNHNKYRYKVEFYNKKELNEYILCNKKKDVFQESHNDSSVNTSSHAKVVEIMKLGHLNKSSYDVTTESDFFDVSGINSHNCRTQLGDDIHGYKGKGGRGNISPVTINLTKIGLDNGIALGERNTPDIDGFWKQLNAALDITTKALLERYEWQCSQIAKSSPFMYGNALWKSDAYIEGEDTLQEALKHGTLAIGYLGIANMCVALFGKHQGESKEVYDFALSVVKYIHEYAKRKTQEYQLNFSSYGTPAESLCHSQLKRTRDQYGNVEGVLDREYITNSFHVPVYHPVTIKEKLELEAPFHQYSTGGSISYVELDGNARNNLKAFEQIVDYAMSLGISYFAVNHPIDSCENCGYEGIIGEECPSCHKKDGEVFIKRLRRVTGYLTSSYKEFFNNGKRAEVEDRVKHGGFRK